jgi:type IV pilus assembly protein PilF
MPRKSTCGGVLLALAVLLASFSAAHASRRGATARSPEISRAGELNISLAYNYMNNGQLDVALERALRAERSDPRSALVHAVQGMIYQRLGNGDRAGAAFARADQYGAEEGRIQNMYAAWLCERERYDEAAVHFATAIADPLFQEAPLAMNNAARCRRSAGDLAGAEQHYRQALSRQPENQTALRGLAEVMLSQSQPISARAFLERLQALRELDADELALGIRIEDAAGDARAAARYRQRLQEYQQRHPSGDAPVDDEASP